MLAVTPRPQLTPSMERLVLNQSASQCKTYASCPRHWAMEKIYKIKDRDRYVFAIGHALHGVAERYISKQAQSYEQLFPPGWDARLYDEDKEWVRRSAQDAVSKGIWQAKEGIQVEYPLAYLVGREHLDHRGMPLVAEASTYEDDKGVKRIANLKRLVDGLPLPNGWNRLPPYVGFVDVLDLHSSPPLIGDHKTAAKRRWALSPEKLAKDTQVLSYAALPLALRPSADVVALRHFVFLKDHEGGDGTYVTKAEATIDSVRNKWSDLIQIGEEMAALRIKAPIVDIPGHPEERARNYHLVPCAIDTGNTEACNAYGGCPFRDVCYNRATIQQVTTRLDSPDPLEALEKKGHVGARAVAEAKSEAIKRHGLNPATLKPPSPKFSSPTTTASPKESPMAFAKPNIFIPGKDVYALDPDNKGVQYRARVQGPPDANGEVPVQFYPDVDVVPNWETLPAEYSFSLPVSSCAGMPFVGAKPTGYKDALIAAGLPAPKWDLAVPYKPAPHPQQVAQAPAPAAPVAPAAARATILPGAGAALAQQVGRAQQEEAAAIAAIPKATFVPQLYDQVAVIPSQHSFWGPLSGKPGTIMDVVDTGSDILVTVEVEGVEYSEVSLGRFSFVAHNNTSAAAPAPAVPTTSPALAAVTPPVPPAAPAGLDIEAAKALIGQLVCVRLKAGKSPFNGLLEVADAYGIAMMSGQVKASWEEVASCDRFGFEHVPGTPPPKQPRAKKADAPAVPGPDGVVPPEKTRKPRQKKTVLPEAPAEPGTEPGASYVAGESVGSNMKQIGTTPTGAPVFTPNTAAPIVSQQSTSFGGGAPYTPGQIAGMSGAAQDISTNEAIALLSEVRETLVSAQQRLDTTIAYLTKKVVLKALTAGA